MKFFATFIMALMVMGAGSYVYAAEDEFGSRFGNETPTALRDDKAPTDNKNVQDIEPAAGEESDEIEKINDEKNAEKPSEDKTTDLEQDIEKKMGTEVNTSVQELGDGQIKQHDSVGEGTVRTFYKSETDGRVMDNNDAAGVEVKVLEFK